MISGTLHPMAKLDVKPRTQHEFSAQLLLISRRLQGHPESNSDTNHYALSEGVFDVLSFFAVLACVESSEGHSKRSIDMLATIRIDWKWAFVSKNL